MTKSRLRVDQSDSLFRVKMANLSRKLDANRPTPDNHNARALLQNLTTRSDMLQCLFLRRVSKRRNNSIPSPRSPKPMALSQGKHTKNLSQ